MKLAYFTCRCRYRQGDAELVFSAEDFSNFLVHPLTVTAAKDNGPGGHEFVFDGGEGEGKVCLDAGAVCFSGRWMKDGGWWPAMKPQSGGVAWQRKPAPRDGASVENDGDGDGDGDGNGGRREGRWRGCSGDGAFFGTLMIDLVRS